MPYHTPLRWAVALVLAVPSVTAFADDEARVAPVVVTATRTAQTADETLSSVSVISREDIEREQATSLPELLDRVQGLEFTQNGGRGNASSVFIRGTNSDHVIVLIDGVRVGSATLGTTSFESLPLENIERIEVVRGPRSSLYGADAVGGVIQIFTRESDGARVGIASGSHDYRRLSTGYGVRGDEGGFSIDLSAEETDGIDARENDCFFCADEPDDDGYENASASLRGNRAITDTIEISGSLLVSDSETEFDGSFQNSSEQRQTAASGRLDWQVTNAWDSRFSVGRSTDESETFLDGNDVGFFDTVRQQVGWQNDVFIGDAQLVTAGIDVLRDEIDSATDFDVDERQTTGVFLQHQWTGMSWDTQANIRRETFDDGFDNPNTGSEFDDQTTGSIAAGYRLDEGLRTYASYGTAFKAPSFNQLFFPGFGNPDLDPEKSKSLEVGLRGSDGNVNWEIAAYRTEIEDLIVTAEISPGVFAPDNVDEARIQGIEFGIDGTWDDWHASFNADFKDPDNTETGNTLRRRSERGYNAGLTHELGRWTLGGDVTYEGPRFDDAANTVRMGSYMLLDVRATWNFAPDWNASFKIDNVGDVDYTLVDTYNTDSRVFLFQLDWRPGNDGA